jgi:beta-galactosidase
MDNAGNLIPDAAIKVNLNVAGDGELVASGNAAPNDMESFRNVKCKTYNGRCMAIIRPFTRAGIIKVSAEAEDLPKSTVEIETK